MIPVKRISHATLETPDLDRQIDYYTDVVGLVLIAQDTDRAIFASRLGNLALVLHRGSTARPTLWDRKSAALMWGPPQGPDHARQRLE